MFQLSHEDQMKPCRIRHCGNLLLCTYALQNLRSPATILLTPLLNFPVKTPPLPRFGNSPEPFSPTATPFSAFHTTLALSIVYLGQFRTSMPSNGV